MRKTIFVLALTLIANSARAQGAAQPCLNIDRLKVTTINTNTATTNIVVLNSAPDQSILVCGYHLVMTGGAAANQVTWIYGTGALCATGGGTLSLVTYSGPAATTFLVVPQPMPFAKIIAGNSLCMILSQAQLVQGTLTYVIY